MATLPHTQIDLQPEALTALCETHYVEQLWVFGSVLRPDFHADSDIDFLVKFTSFPREDYFDNYIAFKEGLATIFKRKIDLLELQTLKNPILKRNVFAKRQKVYG
jgi:predicted nucleotidyltransferase